VDWITLQIWQKVKSANPSLSVCEVGATIGRMWREMGDINKQHYNDDFALDKVRYTMSLEFLWNWIFSCRLHHQQF